MKSIHNIIKYTFAIVVIGLSVFLSSCSDDDDDNYSSNLEITSVSLATNDSAVVGGYRENMYIIRGTGFVDVQNIYFNDVDTYFNPTYVTSTVIFVTIDESTPYVYSPEQLRIVTASGEADYDFDILQPSPIIESFTPKVGGEGTEVTIIGSIFDNLESVYFGDAEATIVSNTDTEIVVTAPEVEEPTTITVTTAGGSTESVDYYGGLSYTIYDEALNTDWWSGGWGETNDFANTEHVNEGTYAIKTEISSWSAFQVGNGGASIDASEYTTLQFDIYAESDGNILIAMNYDYSTNVQVVTLTAGQWYTLSYPLEDFGVTTEIQSFAIQEYSGTGNTYYIDNLGFL